MTRFFRPNFPMPHARTRRTPGELNSTEQGYQEHLVVRLHAGEVAWFGFEAIKLRLADMTFYTPDFVVITSEGFIEVHEVKGHWEDDARVKFKVAARLFPWAEFVAVKKRAKRDGGGFVEVERIASGIAEAAVA